MAAHRAPRIFRPARPHESTGVHGRGTEEVKTNDVRDASKRRSRLHNRVRPPRRGRLVPRYPEDVLGAGPSRRRVSRRTNPVTSLMSDVATGTIREDVLSEKVLSAIVEIKVPVERTEEIIRLVWDVEKQIDTVVSLGVGARCDNRARKIRRSADPRKSSAITLSAPKPTSG